MKDKQIERLIKKEQERKKKTLQLIPSENYISKDVIAALGSVLNEKYAEGYPGKRYYGGCAVVDEVEVLCQNRGLKTFGLKNEQWAINVQPLSGSPANLAVYLALVPIKKADGEKRGKIMGMPLTLGGHLTHGQSVSITGKVWEQIPLALDISTATLDYKKIKETAITEKPDIIVVGFTAYPRIIDFKKCREIADSCGAYLMVDMSHFAGLVAGGAYPSPFPYADVVTTTTHKTLRGPRGAVIFSRKDKTVTNAKGKVQSISELIDKAVFPGLQGGPHENQIAAIAVTFKEASEASFKKYAKQVVKNAQALSSELTKLGWRIISGGTDSHLVLVDTWNGGNPSTTLRAGGIPGKDAEARLEKSGIICNKNTIPNETRSPFDPSGIRLGSPAETTRGKKEADFKKIAQKIDKVLRGK